MATKKDKKPSTQQPKPPINYNYEWAKAIGTVRRAEEAKLARQAQSAANQNAYNKAKNIEFAEKLDRATRYPKPVVRGDALSGRTTEGGTRSLLEGFRAFIRGGGLRSGGR
jgi:hypothetical protein